MNRIGTRTRDEILSMRRAGLVVADVHRALRESCRAGISTAELDNVAYDITVSHGARPNFLGYHGFPSSVCISVNSTVVHGIPSSQKLESGDLVSFDCGAVIKENGRNWHSDAAFSMVVGTPEEASPERVALSALTRGSMWAGIAALADAKRVCDIGAAIEDYVLAGELEYGLAADLIEGYTGHGIGNNLHEEPEVYNYRVRGRSPRIKPGMVLCIEPMVVAGDIATRVLDDEWTVVTVDNSDAAHWEHTVAVLEDGISVLTAPDCGVEELKKFGITPVVLD